MKKIILLLVVIFSLQSCGDGSSPSKSKTDQVTINAYKNGYSLGKENKYDESDPYTYWNAVKATNDANITATFISDYSKTWAQGYTDGFKGNPSKY